ncbi:MAG: hypothetical protein K2P58_01255 [Hyphomonadaceae bacterium]|nr:hypothetical protein [Hyphomonadaceae bacterium]
MHRAPVLYYEGERRRSDGEESICDLEEQALIADEWELVEPGFRERFVILRFEDGKLSEIRLMWRGWDP